jgi:hypothetical protein
MTGDVHQTILEECWKPAFARYLVPKYTGLQRDLEQYLTYYNTDRVHHGRWTTGPHPRGCHWQGEGLVLINVHLSDQLGVRAA